MLLYIHHLPLAVAIKNYASFLPHTVNEFGLILTLSIAFSEQQKRGDAVSSARSKLSFF
jgi:hypothetical protein